MFSPIVLIIVFAIIVNILQIHSPNYLPQQLQTWLWVPRPFRTLSWYDENFCQKRLNCWNRNELKQSTNTIGENISNSYSCTNITIGENISNIYSITTTTFDDNDSDRLSGITVSTRF